MDAGTQTRELLGEIRRARFAVVGAIATSTAGWGEPPRADEWSVRQIAQHVIENDYFFGGEVARVLGRAAVGTPAIECPTPGAAVDAFAAAEVAVAPALSGVSDGALVREWQGGMSLADLLAFYAEHTREHLEQIEATRGALAVAS